MAFSPTEELIGNIVMWIFCSLSFITSLATLFSSLIFKSFKTHRGRVIMFLMVSELMCSAEKFISYISCILESWVSQVGFMSGFMWRLCFATTLYFAIVHNKKEKFLIKLEPLYHILAWGVGISTAIVCQVFGVFGQAGLFCWIIMEAQWARMGLFYIPLLLIIIVMAIIFSVIMISVCIQLRKSAYLKTEHKRIQELLIYQKLSIFLIAFVLGRIWSVSNRFTELIFGQSLFILALFHTIGSYSQGIVSAIVYGTTEKFHKKYWGLVKSCFRCICRKRSSNPSSPASEKSSANMLRSVREHQPVFNNSSLEENLMDTTLFPPSPTSSSTSSPTTTTAAAAVATNSIGQSEMTTFEESSSSEQQADNNPSANTRSPTISDSAAPTSQP